MTMKKTKRKAFNFLRSYFDVFNKLQTDEDKLSFLTAILNKQFLNEEPKELKFPVDLAYDSQVHALTTSVKGWLRASKTDLQGNPLYTPSTTHGGKTQNTPKEEEEKEKGEEKGEEQEKEKEEEQYVSVWPDFQDIWDHYEKKVGSRKKIENKWNKLPQETKEAIYHHVTDYKLAQPDKKFRKNFETYLNNEAWRDEIIESTKQGLNAQTVSQGYLRTLDKIKARQNAS